jgi:hypothetical protein
MTRCESAVNSNRCLRASSVSAGRRPDSGYSPPSRSGGPSTLRPIAGRDYRTRKPTGSIHEARNSCSNSTAAGPSTAHRDGTWRATSIILAGRMRNLSGAKAASCSSPCAVSNRARKSPSTTERNTIASFARMAAAVVRHAAPKRSVGGGKRQQRGNPSKASFEPTAARMSGGRYLSELRLYLTRRGQARPRPDLVSSG